MKCGFEHVQKALLLGYFSIYYCKGKNGECIPNQTIQDKVHTENVWSGVSEQVVLSLVCMLTIILQVSHTKMLQKWIPSRNSNIY
ncbi:unnamed protein product [Sphagnum troendelagicum]|uniref:Uncharacterized protein n=1 Tax=Sphagnum troendelagicum TaxID=128251 RepID=A0ABP0V3F9_9BRYO